MMRLKFDTRGNDKQKEVCRLWIDDDVLEILFGGSKGGGKSFLGVVLIFGDAFTYPGTFYFIARKVQADLVKFTIPSIHEVFESWGIGEKYYTFNNKYNYFQLHNGSRVYLLDAKYLPSDPTYSRFGSMQMTRGWIEEAGEFERDAKANLQASIGRWKNDDYGLAPKLLLTCNPANNFLYTDYYKPDRDGTLPAYRRFVKALPTDNKMLPADYVDNLVKILTPSQCARLVHGEWEYDDDPNLLVDYDAVCDVFTFAGSPPVHRDGLPRLSTDLAGKGRDKWVVALDRDNVIRFPVVRSFSEGREMEEKLQSVAASEGVPRSRIVSDADGLGFYLESYMKGITEFHGGARPHDPTKYANLKSECAFKLADKIMKRQIRVECDPSTAESLKAQLMCLRATNTNSAEAKRQIISKDRMKEVIGHSPDHLDALIMLQVFDVKRPARGAAFPEPGKMLAI